MKKIIINGSFLCRNLTGIERFSLEICKRLNTLDSNNLFELYIPKDSKNIPVFQNLKITVSKKKLIKFPLWDHFTFPSYVKKQKGISLNFANLTSLFHPGLVFIHDIYAKLYPQDFTSKKDKLRRFYMCWMYKYAVKKGKHIFTVSEFSKNQIIETYKVDSKKITVIPNGWDHFKEIQPDDSIIKNNPKLQNDFYFTLGSLSQRKNLKWIADYAEKHPSEFFAISGKMLSGLVPPELEKLKTLKNIVLLGYVSDGHVKALIQKCKAFVFPSYYEGFGIPPLEALSCGTKIIVSKSASLPEIYGETAHYIDADNTNVELSELLTQPVAKPDEILEKYTYENAAKDLYKVLSKYI